MTRLNTLLAPGEKLAADDIREIWRLLATNERVDALELLPREDADDLFISLAATEQAEIVLALTKPQEKSYMRLLAPDDVADVIQESPEYRRNELFELLDERTRAEVIALLRYKEDVAGGLMNPRYVRLHQEMTAEEALFYLRRQTSQTAETIYVAYALDDQQRLQGALSLRELLQAKNELKVADIMQKRIISVSENTPQEEVSRIFSEYDLHVLPVVDQNQKMKGIVTVDDIVDVVREEATEDIQRLGGLQSLDRPYPQLGIFQMLQKRAGWLVALFIPETFTATAIGYYETQMQRTVILGMFLTLIASAGGNSGSQSTALVVRALALGELKMRDWFLVMRRELGTGLFLGLLLGTIGMLRVILWGRYLNAYGIYYPWVGLVVGITLVFVVLWGTLSGAMLPFLIRKLGFDPATASAPFVATFVDVTAIVIYFNVAQMILHGLLL